MPTSQAKWATKPLRFVYESGPCGFQLAREIRAMGIFCDIIAVTIIPRSTEDRWLKDDRRDAQSLFEAVTAPSCKCKTVYAPSEESEAPRDLCRAYYDMVLATKAEDAVLGNAAAPRHRLEREDAHGEPEAHVDQGLHKVAKSIRLPVGTERQTLKFYLKGVLDGLDRCNEIRRKCIELSENERSEPYVDALTRLKGVDRC
ncbi:MAG: transposase [Atopobiaceae bacterium]|nr:transposase [Atopobiaceae bacterium]